MMSEKSDEDGGFTVPQDIQTDIKDFNPEALTNRQKLLICMYVKEAYDNRDRTAPTDDKVRFAVQSMMLKERLK